VLRIDPEGRLDPEPVPSPDGQNQYTHPTVKTRPMTMTSPTPERDASG
jgi:hypothetical protein